MASAGPGQAPNAPPPPVSRPSGSRVGWGRAADRVAGACAAAQLAAHALLQAVRMAVELVPSVEPGSGGRLRLRVLLGQPLLEHGLEGHAEAGDGIHETGLGLLGLLSHRTDRKSTRL